MPIFINLFCISRFYTLEVPSAVSAKIDRISLCYNLTDYYSFLVSHNLLVLDNLLGIKYTNYRTR